MTPQELADQTGLSLDEAEMVLIARAAKGTKPMEAVSRFQQAMDVLMKAERKVGLRPSEESK